ncbi:hypothetical protein FSP39_005921 [Pinctada imbricata]|uniref:Jumonji domain-containing protein 4 n=1 Tax=Pinctada imbricata TaxID=66713 RepID=A0AA88XHB9_PINIB|nr:hypothetical protein FSP39_005921 [Pinctada imbricata]
MKFTDFMAYWKDFISRDYPPESEILYLKDWHFNKVFPEYKAYQTPVYFSSDWLNEFWDTRDDNDDYRFVYMGPKGSWTPFHADVFRSYSWSANICGKKKWILFPPGEEKCLTNKYGHLAFDVTSEELKNENLYPHYCDLHHCYEVIQEAGEIIFVPSGWHHQVHNLEDTISINHNWINGCNIRTSWEFIKSSLRDVQTEIEDCRDMEGWHNQCQVILKASSGIDFNDFYNFMELVAENRIKRLKEIICGDEYVQNKWNLTCAHSNLKFDENNEIGNKLFSMCNTDNCLVKDINMKDYDTAFILGHGQTEHSENLVDGTNTSFLDLHLENEMQSEIEGSLDKTFAGMIMENAACTGSDSTDLKWECSDRSNKLERNTTSPITNSDSVGRESKECENVRECSNRHLDDIRDILRGFTLPNDFNPDHPIHLTFDLKVVRLILKDMMKSFSEVDIDQELVNRVSYLILKIDDHV